MGFFTIGNIITLGIVLLILLLYRQLDRNNRTLKLLRDYAEKLKSELSEFVKEQEKAVKDYSVSLNVERDSAKELMKHLKMKEDELAEKANEVASIDAQIKSCQNSLLELDQMTGRVQENMNRVRDESLFVDNVGKRIGEVKTRIIEMEKGLAEIESKFERENAEALEKTSFSLLASVKSVVSDLGAAAETIERQVEDHRTAINKIEEDHAANIARDTEHINKILSSAVEQAGEKADKMEEAALVSLREQAEDRIVKLKNAEDEKFRLYDETAKARVAEVQELIKSIREEWQAERNEWDTIDKNLRDERKKDALDLNSLIDDSKKRVEEFSLATEGLISSQEAALIKAAEEMRQKSLEINRAKLEEHRQALDLEFRNLGTLADDSKKLEAELRRNMQEVENRTEGLITRADEIVTSQEAMLLKAAEDMKQKALEVTGAKLEEYHRAQDAEFRRLEGLADDSRKLDAELRRYMQELNTRLREDFSQYEKESEALRKTESGKFSSAAAFFQNEVSEAEKKLDTLKALAYDNVSEKLSSFENSFASDLSAKSAEVERRLLQWQENLDRRIAGIAADTEAARLEFERIITEETRNRLSLHGEKVASDLDHLKSETEAFEEALRGQMNASDELVSSFKEQIDLSLEETRKGAEISVKAETGKHSLIVAETIKQHQRELDDAKAGITVKLRELDNIVEDSRRRLRDLTSETDNRIASVRSSIDETEGHMREAVDHQTQLLDKADAFKLEMERRIEDLKSEIDRLDQRKMEAEQLENYFNKIKRLGDDVNTKMTRFFSEERRINAMETGFTRLLQTSKAVEEKLGQVVDSDDTLQGIQLQIRKLEEALVATDEKYQRIEKKSQVLDNTSDGIDRNFKMLQESEKLSLKIDNEIGRHSEDLDFIKTSIEKLAAESDRAKEAVDRIDVLDNALEEIEERIKSMQRARQWIVDAEARLEDLNKQAQTQARVIDTIVKGKKSTQNLDIGKGAPSLQKRENIISLFRQGWSKEEIAKALKITVGEVELTIEVTPQKD